jgi:hypothetical protein
VEPEETAVAMQRFGKHVPTAINTRATIDELLDAVFSMRLVPRSISICSSSENFLLYCSESRSH